MMPETKYAKSGDVSIAYQVTGSGPLDLIYVMGWVSNIEFFWEEPSMSHFLNHLASFPGLSFLTKGVPVFQTKYHNFLPWNLVLSHKIKPIKSWIK